MFEFLPRQFRQGLLQVAMVGIGEEHLDRCPGGLLLAMGMIKQHLVEVRFSAG